MKLLKETLNNHKINIIKFNKKDLILKDNGVLIIGKYKPDGTNLPPLEHKRIWVKETQLAQADNFIYIPEDQLKKYFDNKLKYSFPRIIDSKEISTNNWQNLKTNYPYTGV